MHAVNLQDHEQAAGLYQDTLRVPPAWIRLHPHASQVRCFSTGYVSALSWVTLLRCELSPLEFFTPVYPHTTVPPTLALFLSQP